MTKELLADRISKRGRVNEGAPTKYKPEYCDLLIEHMKLGKSYETFAAKIPDNRVHRNTLDNWGDVNPEFLSAKKRGQLLSKKHWEDLGEQLILGEVKGSIVGWIFVMKCRFGYMDNITDISSMSNEQIIELAKKALEKLRNE